MTRKKAPRKNGPAKKVAAVRHKDRRKNIPTEELRDFVRQDEQQPKTLRYPRDPDLDPQLVCKGRDHEDVEGASLGNRPVGEDDLRKRAIRNMMVATWPDASGGQGRVANHG